MSDERPMDPYFREALEGLRDAAEAMMTAHGAIIRALAGVLHAKSEHEDLRDTVLRLEALVIEQGGEIRDVREELRHIRERLNGSV